MKNSVQIGKIRIGADRVMLAVPLLVLSALIPWAMVSFGHLPPAFIPGAIVGVTACLLAFMFPLFGYYLSTGISFFIYAGIRYTNTELPVLNAIDLLVLMSFLGILLEKIMNRKPFWENSKSPILTAYGIILVYSFIELFNPNGGSLELSLLMLRKFIVLLLFFYCSLHFLKDVKAMHLFLKIWILFTFFNALYACYELFVGMPKWEIDFIQADPLRERLSSLDNGTYRKSGFLSGMTDFGLFMASMSTIVLVFLLKMKAAIEKKFFLLLLLSLFLVAMSSSGTRTATVMITVNVVLYIIMTLSDRRTMLFAICTGAIFAFLMFAPIYGNPSINRLRSTFSKDESLQVRDINRHGIQPYMHKHPIGGGLGTTGVLNMKYNPGHPLTGFPTDSGLLKFALEYGWIGLILQCVIYFLIVQQGIRGYFSSQDPEHKMLYMLATLTLFGYVVAQYAQIAIGQIPGGFLFFALIAMIIKLRNIERVQVTK